MKATLMKATLSPPAFSCMKRRPSWRDQVLSKSKIAVLVVEDIPQICAIAIQLFEELGCTVFDAYNGQQALKLLQSSSRHPGSVRRCAHARHERNRVGRGGA